MARRGEGQAGRDVQVSLFGAPNQYDVLLQRVVVELPVRPADAQVRSVARRVAQQAAGAGRLADALQAYREGLAINPSDATFTPSKMLPAQVDCRIRGIMGLLRATSTKDGRNIPNVATSAPGTPARIYPINVAVVNTGTDSDGPVLLQLQPYDGDGGGAPKGDPVNVWASPGDLWMESFLRWSVANGWVKITRMFGTAPWFAYGIVHDGGKPGERTGDGAYVPMVK